MAGQVCSHSPSPFPYPFPLSLPQLFFLLTCNPMHRPYSAYMLFYRRVEPLLDSPVWLPPDESAKLVPPEIYKGIWQENTDFFRDKYICDTTYFEFLWSVVVLQHAPSVEGRCLPFASRSEGL